MSSFFGSGPLPDWKEVRKWLGKELPWNLVEQWEKADDGAWLDRYIQGVLKEQSGSPQAQTKSLVQIDTVKNARKITVSVRIPPRTDGHELRFFATSDRLRITGLPDRLSHSVRFPSQVIPRSGKAVQKDGQILVTFKRRAVNEEEVELFIRS